MSNCPIGQIAILLFIAIQIKVNAEEFVVISNQKDIWTTSTYSYAPGGSGPGGGANDGYLRIGGWGDTYLSLLDFDITSLPANATKATLRLYAAPDTSNPTGFYLDRITAAWDWRTSGTGRDRDRLWWADRPATVQWSTSVIQPPTRDAWNEIDITPLYNAWRNGSIPYHGIQIRPANTSNNNFEHFYSADYANTALRPQLVVSTDATFQPLPNYQYNLADGRQSLQNLLITQGGQCSFIFGTSDPGAICIVSSSSNLLQWSPLLQFTSNTAGAEILDTPRAPNKFYRATYLPTGVSVASAFDYPIGSGNVLEQIIPERNNIFPSAPVADPGRGASAPGSGWYNAQDVGNYYAPLGGIHPGEDWNLGSGADDVGQPQF